MGRSQHGPRLLGFGQRLIALLILALIFAPVAGGVNAGPRDRDRDQEQQQQQQQQERARDGGGDETGGNDAENRPSGGDEQAPALDPVTGPSGSDGDADYFPDIIDNCPSVPNTDQRDEDGDGVGDACETRQTDGSAGGGGDGASDIDGDGVGDNRDNCREIANGGQGDADGDGIGNQCDGSPNGDPAPGPPPAEAEPPRDAGPRDGGGGGGGDGGGESVGEGEVGAAEDGGAETGRDGVDDSGGGGGGGGERDFGSEDGAKDGGGGERDQERRDVSAPSEPTADDGGRAPGGGGERSGGSSGDGDADGGSGRTVPIRPAVEQPDGEAPAPELAPRPPDGPPPVLEPFVVPDSAFEPLVRINAGFPADDDDEVAAGSRAPASEQELPTVGARTETDRGESPTPERKAVSAAVERRERPERNRARDAASPTADPAEAADPGDGDVAADEDFARPQPGDGFLDREESLLGDRPSAPSEGDPLDGEGEPRPADQAADELDGDPAPDRRGWMAAGVNAPSRLDEDDSDPGWMIAGIDDRSDPEGGIEPGGASPDPEPADGPGRAGSGSRSAAGVGSERGGGRVEGAADSERAALSRGTGSDRASDWEDDDYFAGGVALAPPDVEQVLGTERDRVYLSQREGRVDRGEFSYAIPLPEEGTFLVRLHLAELAAGAGGGAGRRVFSVDAEGRTELEDYDIAADVGPLTAVVKEFEVAVEDGTLDLDFYASRGRPAVAAIEVLAEPDGDRWVDVDKGTETVRLMVGQRPVASYRASLSEGAEDDFHDTMPGSYRIQSKIAELTYTPYADNYFMYWAGFDPGRENGFHSWVMDAKGRVVPNGDGPTWGCVATAPEDAAEIYGFVEIGTRVEIHW